MRARDANPVYSHTYTKRQQDVLRALIPDHERGSAAKHGGTLDADPVLFPDRPSDLFLFHLTRTRHSRMTAYILLLI